MNAEIKILILEDNPTDADLLERALKKSGLQFASLIVKNREEFEVALDQFKPDIILSDYSLPSFDGVTAFHLKQQKLPDAIPFIIVSGIIGAENAVELIKKGVTDYEPKDKLSELHQKIIRALKDSEMLQQKKVADEMLKVQYEKLLEIAFLQSHQVRVPIVHILSLYDLFNFENPADPINAEILGKLKMSAESLDKLIKEIVEKTNELEAMKNLKINEC